MPTVDANEYRLSFEIRRLENSWRFAGDVLIALMNQIKAANPTFSMTSLPIPATTNDPTGPKPPCPLPPPAPCHNGIDYLRQVVNALAQNGVAVADAMDAVFDKAEDLKIKKLTLQVTQYPEYPSGVKVEKLTGSKRPAVRATARR